jgi:hypothetical protein
MSWKFKKKLIIKNWKETARDRRTWRDLAEKVKTQKSVVVTNDDDDDPPSKSMHAWTRLILDCHTLSKVLARSQMV